MKLIRTFIFVMLSLGTALETIAQVKGRRNFETIKVDLKNGFFVSNKALPFDVPFVLKGQVLSEITEVHVYYSPARACNNVAERCACDCDSTGTGVRQLCVWRRHHLTRTSTPDSFQVLVPPLKANSNYRFCITTVRGYDSVELKQINIAGQARLSGIINGSLSSTRQLTVETIRAGLEDSLFNNLEAMIRGIVPGNTRLTMSAQELKVRSRAQENPNLPLLADAMVKMNTQLMGKEADEKVTDALRLAARNDLRKLLYHEKMKLSVPLKKFLSALIGADGSLVQRGYYNTRRDSLEIATDVFALNDLSSLLKMLANTQEVKRSLRALDDTLRNNAVAPHLAALRAEIEQWASLVEGLMPRTDMAISHLVQIIEQRRRIDDHLKVLTLKDALDRVSVAIPLSGFTTEEFMTRAEYYITADLGLALVAFDQPEIYSYAGVNFNFAPINREARYRSRNFRHFAHPWWYIQTKNLSGVVGITFSSITHSTTTGIETRRSVLKIGSAKPGLLTGVAYRLGDFGRLTVGAMWMEVRDENLLNDKYTLTAYPYVSLSLDLDVKGKTGDLFNLMFPSATK